MNKKVPAQAGNAYGTDAAAPASAFWPISPRRATPAGAERNEVIDFFLSHFHFPSTRECEAKPTDADATRLHVATYEPIRNPLF